MRLQLARYGFALLALALGLACSAARAQAPAQDETAGTYVTPFPEADTYRLQVYGDAFAESLLPGLVEAMQSDARVQIQRKHRALGSLTRAEVEDEVKAEEGARDTVHIGVVMLGYGDRGSIRPPGGGRRINFGSEEWRTEYGRRVDRLIKAWKKRGIALYWVGLPIMRRTDANEDSQAITEIIREKAFLNGVRFIDIYAQFADEAGNYDRYGPDINGKVQILREGDGIGLTTAGNRKLAHFIEREIRRDLTQARNARAIPLAGSEAEQKRINPQRSPPVQSAAQWKGTVAPAKDAKSSSASRPASGQQSPAADGAGDQKADNSRVTLKRIAAGGREETVTVDILRPPIPAAVIALVTRREAQDPAAQPGEALTEDLGGGLTVLNTVTPSSEAGTSTRRRAPVMQAPAYKVLVKGERLPAKPGRMDEFTWPRTEPPPPAPAPVVTRAPVRPVQPPPAPQRPSPRS